MLEPGQEVAFRVQLNNYENVSSATGVLSLRNQQGNEIDSKNIEWKSKLQGMVVKEAWYEQGLRLEFDVYLKNKHNEAISLNLLTYHWKVFYGDRHLYTEKIEGEKLTKFLGQTTLDKESETEVGTHTLQIPMQDNATMSMEELGAKLTSKLFIWFCVSIEDQDGQLLGCTKEKIKEFSRLPSKK